MVPAEPPEERRWLAHVAQTWLFRNFSNDMRSAIYSVALAGILAAVSVGWIFAREPPKVTSMAPNDIGITTPVQLFADVRQEGIGSIEFLPPELEGVYICDNYFARGETYWNMVLDFLGQYRQCFVMSQNTELSFAVHAYEGSGKLVQKNGSYYCNCASEIIDKHLAR